PTRLRFVFPSSGVPLSLHPFPTRRSSDLGPGRAVFDGARAELRRLPLIAEDLGVITPAVTRLRESLGLPGMVVLQFAFDPSNPRSEEHTSELQSRVDLVCRLLLEKKKEIE